MTSPNEPVEITGVHLYTTGSHIVVALEMGGRWVPVISERGEVGPISHICEPSGLRKAAALPAQQAGG